MCKLLTVMASASLVVFLSACTQSPIVGVHNVVGGAECNSNHRVQSIGRSIQGSLSAKYCRYTLSNGATVVSSITPNDGVFYERKNGNFTAR